MDNEKNIVEIYRDKIIELENENQMLYDALNKKIDALYADELKNITESLSKLRYEYYTDNIENYAVIKNGVIDNISKIISIPLKGRVKYKPDGILGKNNYENIKELYNKNGISGINTIISSKNYGINVIADIYKELSKVERKRNLNLAIKFARLSWFIHPKSHRLKWMAFRIYESGDSLTSNLIFKNYKNEFLLNDNELKVVDKIKNDSENYPQHIYNKLKQLNKKTKNTKNIDQDVDKLYFDIINDVNNKSKNIYTINDKNENSYSNLLKDLHKKDEQYNELFAKYNNLLESIADQQKILFKCFVNK